MIVVEESSQVVCPITTKLVLDEDEETKEPLVQVHRNLVTKLKPHQVDGKDTMHKEFWTGRSWRKKKKAKQAWGARHWCFLSCVFCVPVRSAVYVGLLLWIGEKNWEVFWLWLHPCPLYGPGKDSASELLALYCLFIFTLVQTTPVV